ncbi:MAG: hypothetical protein R6V83_13830 [Candidatus Thorarchaeota archaeon]
MGRSGADMKKLVSVGDLPLCRLRIGDYRAIYFVDGEEVKVTQMIHRNKGYKWLECVVSLGYLLKTP